MASSGGTSPPGTAALDGPQGPDEEAGGKSAEAIVVEVIQRRVEPIENREWKPFELIEQKPRKGDSVEGKGRKPAW